MNFRKCQASLNSAKHKTAAARAFTKINAVWQRTRYANSFATNAILTASANVVIAAFGMITGILAARLLGPHGRGELAAIQTTPTFIASLAMLGTPEALVYYSAQNPSKAGRYLGSASAIALAASIPFMAAGYLAMPTLLDAQGRGVVAAGRWYLLITPIWATAGMLPHPLRGTGNFAAWNIMRSLVPVSAIMVLSAAWMSGYATARAIAFGTLACNALLFAPFLWLVQHHIRGPYGPQRKEIRLMVEYGLPCMMTGLPQILNLRLDQMLMAAIVPARDLGLYVVAVAWSGAVFPLLTSIGSAILPSVASADSNEVAVVRLGQGVRAACAAALLLCAVVVVVTPVAIVVLFGSSYRGAIPAALVLVPAAGILGVNLALQESIRGLGFPYSVLRAELCGLAITAVSLGLTLRPFGILGAAMSSLLGYSAVTAVLVATAMRLAAMSVTELLIPRTQEVRTGLRRIGAVARSLVAI